MLIIFLHMKMSNAQSSNPIFFQTLKLVLALMVFSLNLRRPLWAQCVRSEQNVFWNHSFCVHLDGRDNCENSLGMENEGVTEDAFTALGMIECTLDAFVNLEIWHLISKCWKYNQFHSLHNSKLMLARFVVYILRH